MPPLSRTALDRWLLRHPMPASFQSKEAKAEYFGSMPEVVRNEWSIRKAKQDIEDPKYNGATAERARKRMARVDEMSPDLRAIVYEHGLEVVQEFLNCGVKFPKTIKHLIDTVLHHDLPNGQRRFKINKGASAKPNPIYDDDDYFVIPSVKR
jgi:hypothetical protein